MIILQHITKTIGNKILFDDISLKIGESQKVGLVGPNGAGKTTLLSIISGSIEPDSGTVITSQETLGLLPQKLIAGPSTSIGEYLKQALSQDWETYKISEALSKVGLQKMPLTTLIAKLSGGQKMKVGLAKVLLTNPTTLLLDEPTNNLDTESLSWLEHFVQDFEGKVLLISHDRFFLDACVNKIIDLDPFTQKVVEYGGNYSSFVVQKQQRHQNLTSDYQLQQLQQKEMHDWIVQKQEQLKYHINPKVAKQLQAMKNRYEREFVTNALDKPQTYASFKVATLGSDLHQKKSVLAVKNFTLYDLLSIPELYIFGQERIHLAGSNGSGKTTFLKSLIGELQVHTGSIQLGENIKLGYFSQEHEVLEEHELVIQTFMTHTKNFSDSRARKILGSFLFTKEKVFSQIKFLSEGEKARLLLAIIIHQNNDFLLLDEPTNHLDLESREVLAQALKSYEGGFLVISHDRYFLQQVGIQRTLTVTGGSIVSQT